MGTLVKRGSNYRAVVRLAGQKAMTKSFDNVRDAKAWMAATETGLRQVREIAARNDLTLSEVIAKHREEILMRKPYKVHLATSLRFEKDFADVGIADMTHARQTRRLTDGAATDVGPGTERAAGSGHAVKQTVIAHDQARRWIGLV